MFMRKKIFILLICAILITSYQVEKANSDRCFGLAADNDYLLVCEYGCNGANPEIIVYKKG